MPKISKKLTKPYSAPDNFSKRIKNIPPGIVSKIARIDELKGRWIAGIRLSPQVLGRLKRSVLITSTGASTRIEGARLTDKDIEKLMRGINIQKFTNRDKQEAQGYYELLENIFNSWKGLKFNENLIKHFHRELLKYVDKDKSHRGENKKGENKVHMIDDAGQSIGILFDTAPAYLTPAKMRDLIEWTQKTLKEEKYQPLLVIGNFLVEFLKIHPFTDGNGRLSRLLTNLLLLHTGYLYMPYVSHEKLVEDNKPDYYIALRRSQKNLGTKKENIIDWLNFFLDTILKQSQLAVELLSKENIEKILSEKQLIVWRYVEKVKETSTRDIMKHTKIARPTIKQSLEALLRLKKIERIGLGRSSRYRKL
ncbi:Fic family protein [Patescibacteria group bacterium]|nr:Fic family protein [Patescibacteria group bacterium]MBU1016049.1 Fic family protein [Patescibacteria group bacterium]MBU1684753.1 Fic family protein [Patescibacteria group bacterium]MBU1938667.1 Fic family protein [Patescibacteria group bacterium]